MSSEWYYQTEGNEVGPVSAAELKGLVQKGTLKGADLVRKGAEGEWVTVQTIPGLRKKRTKAKEPAVPPVVTPPRNKGRHEFEKIPTGRTTEQTGLVWLGIRLSGGIVLLLFGLYRLFFGGVLWPHKETTYFAGGVEQKITRATPLGVVVVIAILMVSLWLLIPAILRFLAIRRGE